MGRKKLYNTKAEALEAKKLKNKEYYQKNKEKLKLKAKANGVNENSLKYYHANKETLAEKKKIYYKKNKAMFKEYGKKYREENKELIKEKKIKRQFNRRKEDFIYKLRCNVSTLIRISFKNKSFKKKNKSQEILGCSYEEFKLHLESMFEPWMNWGNHGNPKDGVLEPNKTWDIDHILPLSSAKTEDDIIKLNHYTNLRPLCSYNNRFIKKNN